MAIEVLYHKREEDGYRVSEEMVKEEDRLYVYFSNCQYHDKIVRKYQGQGYEIMYQGSRIPDYVCVIKALSRMTEEEREALETRMVMSKLAQ